MATLTQNFVTRDLIEPQGLPLLNKRIMVTGPRQYAHKLAAKLLYAGARPVWLPTIAITSLDDADIQPLRCELDALEHYTHLAFTSKNGIYAVLNLLQKQHRDPGKYLKDTGIRIAALGVDGDVLEELVPDLKVHIRPAESSTQGMVKELVAKNEAKGAKVLCPVPLVKGGLIEPSVVPRFLKALRESGAEPCRVAAYLTCLGSSPEDCEPEASSFHSGGIDAVAFSSTAEAQGLVALLGGQEKVAYSIDTHKVLLAAHGPYTAQGVADVLQCNVPCVSQNFSSFDGLVAALEKYYQTP